MSDLIERAKAALEGITPGPWRWSVNGKCLDGGEYDEVLSPGPVDCMSYCYGGTSTVEGDNLERDREFIAAARTLVPELVAEVERLQRSQRDDQDNAKAAIEERDEALAEVERLRSYRSLPDGMVWQDYYSPDEVLAIRGPLDDEIERQVAVIGRLTPRRIETVGELDALPKLSVVQFRGPGLGEKNRLVWQFDEEWFSPGAPWSMPSASVPVGAFPAVVLWSPGGGDHSATEVIAGAVEDLVAGASLRNGDTVRLATHPGAAVVAALKAAGYAVVKLPGQVIIPTGWSDDCLGAWPSGEDDPVSAWPRGDRVGPNVVTPDDKWLKPEDARTLAAALLAAADAAEAGES